MVSLAINPYYLLVNCDLETQEDQPNKVSIRLESLNVME